MNIIKTDRFVVRKLRPSDCGFLKIIAEDFRNTPYVYYDTEFPTEESRLKEITDMFVRGDMFFMIFTPDEKDFIGYVCFTDDGDVFDMGYSVRSEYKKKGIAYEACTELMDHMKRNYVISKFTAGTALKNIPSVKLLEKLGFSLVGTEILSFHKDENGNGIYFEGGIYEKYLR